MREAARILDLEKLLDRKPSALSGGQRQRVAMGRAICRNPKVYLMDEPLSNLDAKLRVQMRAEISKLHQRLGATIIYVTHDQTEAMTLGTRIVVMKDGVMQQVDSPAKLYSEPCNLFVAGFIGSPQMNFIDATVASGREGHPRLRRERHHPARRQGQGPEGEGLRGQGRRAGDPPRGRRRLQRAPADRTLSERIAATVTVYELLGSEAMIYADVDGGTVSSHVSSGNPARVGSRIEVAFDLDKVHVFDKQSELAIVH